MGVTERKSRERDFRRESIVQAAERILERNGFEGMTIENVAAEAELGKGTLYLYFKNKCDLFHAVVCRGMLLLKKEIEKSVRPKARGIENVMRIARVYYGFCSKYPLYFSAMLHSELFEVSKEEANKLLQIQCCERVSDEIFKLLSKVIASGIQDRSVSSDLDPKALGLFLWIQVSGVLKIFAAKGKELHNLFDVHIKDLMDYQFRLMERALTFPVERGGKK